MYPRVRCTIANKTEFRWSRIPRMLKFYASLLVTMTTQPSLNIQKIQSTILRVNQQEAMDQNILSTLILKNHAFIWFRKKFAISRMVKFNSLGSLLECISNLRICGYAISWWNLVNSKMRSNWQIFINLKYHYMKQTKRKRYGCSVSYN